jgi:hypothetical protein
MYNELNNNQKNLFVKAMCMQTGNTPIKGKLTTNSKVINGGTYNQLVDTGIESKGILYVTKSRGKYNKTVQIKNK